MSEKIELTGKVFGKWTVLSTVTSHKTPSGQTKTYWLCQCACGVKKEVYSSSLLKGKSKHCYACTRVPNGQSAKRNVFLDYQVSARKRGLNFELTENQLHKTAQENCFYCDKTVTELSQFCPNPIFLTWLK